MNRLQHEPSPYLQQHQNNPVDWYPWGEEAFQKAAAEHKPIFLSIGYSTCYWCHVMERECFEKEDVAKVLNEHFVSIKVDREERPDIDSLYMNAVVSLTGHGGWPMSVFLTAERKPFFGGTYFPHAQFLQLLARIQTIWVSEQEKIGSSSAEIAKLMTLDLAGESADAVDDRFFAVAFQRLWHGFDDAAGGFGGAPKFPPHQLLDLLLRIARRTGDTRALHMATRTLERMARGGIYDHIGFGFHRYSVDDQWLVPHFEKMLYDNAQLASVYLDAYAATGQEIFAQVAREVFSYVLRDMMSPDGAFYSAEDAGAVGEEGSYYTWTDNELREILSEAEYAEFKRLYGISKLGNVEGRKNIIHLQDECEWGQKYSDLALAAFEHVRKKRATRPRPHRDEKILTSWNGLMIRALAKGARVLGEPIYLQAAQRAAAFLCGAMFKDGVLHRRWCGGAVGIPGMLDDYASFTQALLDLFETDFQPEWLARAVELQAVTDKLFWNDVEGLYAFSDGTDPTVLERETKVMDHAEPAGNGIAAMNLLRLSELLLDPSMRSRAERMFTRCGTLFERYSYSMGSMLSALDRFLDRSTEVVVASRDSALLEQAVRSLWAQYLPNSSILATAGGASTADVPVLRDRPVPQEGVTFSVCEHGACQRPTTSLDEALAQLKGSSYRLE